MLKKRRRKRKRKKSHKNYIYITKYRYKIDNKYQKAKVKKSRVEFGISKIQC